MNKIYGIAFGKWTPSIHPALKGFTEYENTPHDCDCFWKMEELKKIMAGVDFKSNPRFFLIEQPSSLVTMHQGTTETNYEYLDRFNHWIQNLILSGGKQILWSLKTMYKVGETYTPE